MPIPTSYTEQTLADFMQAELGAVATVLEYTNQSYAEKINDTLLTYGASDISEISGAANIMKLRTIARMFAWKKAVGDMSTRYGFSADGGSYQRQQMFEQAKQMLQSLESEMMTYDPSYAVKMQKSKYKNDPYAYTAEDERTP